MAAASATAVVSEPPRPRNVMSRSALIPWAPPTTGTRPAASASHTRSGRTATMRALVWVESVWKPAWLPVRLSASTPWSCRAMHRRAVAFRSPAVMSMSSSRPGRELETWPARCRSSSVSLPMALTTTTTSVPCRRVRATWSATARMRSGSATEDPPNFCTSRATGDEYRRLDPQTRRGFAPGAPVSSAVVTTTAKRQRQREGRVARMEAERKAAIKAPRRRRVIMAVVVAAVVVGLMALVAMVGGGDDDDGDQAAEGSTTTTEATPSTTAPEKPEVTIPEGPAPTTLQSTDITVGDGEEAQTGDTLTAHYVGKIYATGDEFDSSYERE